MTRRNFAQQAAVAATSLAMPTNVNSQSAEASSQVLPRMDQAMAERFAQLVLKGVEAEYPNKLDHVMNDAREVRGPKDLHPAFYGCFDWHSAVHGHWLLARLLRRWRELPSAPQIRRVFAQHFAPEAITREVDYLKQPNRGSFERTYGWAWLLKLHEELTRSTADPTWAPALAPLAQAFVTRYLAFLPKQDYPIRTGVHPNTAFGLAFAHDWAVHQSHTELQKLIESRARSYFLSDRDWPAQFEPSGADFFSPALQEAALMRRVLPPTEFREWFDRFLPKAAVGQPLSLFTPARVSDRTDLQIVHLDGLNFSRAWCLRAVASSWPRGSELHTALEKSALTHLQAALPHVTSGSYAGEHWLATFALLALEGDAE